MMADRILLVCTANECRSPYAGSLLHSMLSPLSAERIAIRSAGIDVIPGHPMCTEAAARLAEPEATARHRARFLQPHDVEWASLVLVAERRHRAAIARMSPTASTRTFTLREAAALGAASSPNGASIASGATVEAFAERLHEARGLVGPIELDIADGHHRTPREHRRTLDHVGASTTAIANAFIGNDQPGPVHPRTWRPWGWSRPNHGTSTITAQLRDET